MDLQEGNIRKRLPHQAVFFSGRPEPTLALVDPGSRDGRQAEAVADEQNEIFRPLDRSEKFKVRIGCRLPEKIPESVEC